MNKYEIKGIVGEGAYGIVYQARHKETGEIGKSLKTKYLIKYLSLALFLNQICFKIMTNIKTLRKKAKWQFEWNYNWFGWSEKKLLFLYCLCVCDSE